jgi:hypothetical protein
MRFLALACGALSAGAAHAASIGEHNLGLRRTP